MFKESGCDKISPAIGIDADRGYQGLQKIHEKTRIPKKAAKRKPLTKSEKQRNSRISKKRIIIEHVNAKIKVFKIMSYPYRNHLKRHLLRLSLICGIINYELK
jgi:IS5 family transposase